MSYAASLSRLNASMRRAANAEATIDGAVVDALLDQPDDVALHGVGGGVAVRRISVGVLTIDAGAVEALDIITVDSGSYRVTHRDDDGAGWTVLHLERVTS